MLRSVEVARAAGGPYAVTDGVASSKHSQAKPSAGTRRSFSRTRAAHYVRISLLYGVAARIQQITDDALRVEEGSLYPALHRMGQAGWIAGEWRITENNRRARIYRLTRSGQKRLTRRKPRGIACLRPSAKFSGLPDARNIVS
jgi:hypothetical protein